MDYIPAKDIDAEAWSANFATQIANDPTAFGLDASDSTAITAAAEDYANALQLATDPATRTAPTIADKDAKRASMEGTLRSYAQLVNANPAVTDQQRTDIGVTVRSTQRTPTPPPTDVPNLLLRLQQEGQICLAYTQGATGSRKKPAGTQALQISVEVAEPEAPDDFAGHETIIATKTPFYYNAGGIPRGYRIRFTARWIAKAGVGGKTPTGPSSAPVVTVSTT